METCCEFGSVEHTVTHVGLDTIVLVSSGNVWIARIWPIVTDINLSASFSPEFQGAEWTDPDAEVGVGSQFIGTNHNEVFGEFKVPSFIDTYEHEVAFAWRTSDMENPGARWRFDLEPSGSGTRVRYTMILGPGPSGLTAAIEQMPDKEERIINRRVRLQHTAMLQVLAGVKHASEAT